MFFFYHQYNLLNQILAMISHNLFDYLELYIWLGITDVYNGDWRWIYDQTTPKYKFWDAGHPYSTSHRFSKNYNCGIMYNHSRGKWRDYSCGDGKPYICESNFCKFIFFIS
jgi:hypothetical protein